MNDIVEFELPSYEDDVEHFHNHPIAKAIDSFLHAGNDVVYGASVFVPVAGKMQHDRLKKAAAKQAEYKKILAESMDAAKKAKANAELLNVTRDLHRMSQSRSPELFAKSVFIGLFSEFDSFVGNLITAIYNKKSDLFAPIAKTITIGELREYESIDGLKQDMLNKEIESIKRESYVRQFEILEAKVNVELRKFEEWPLFVEISQRRNLLTHADGIVSEQYLAVCGANKCKELPKLGERLTLTSEYIVQAAELLMLVALMLGQTIWRKLLPEEKSISGQHLNEVIFDSLCCNRSVLSIRYSQFGMGTVILKQASNVERRVRIINYALAHQLAENETDCLKILNSEDWSDALRDFSLAVAVLKNDFQLASELMLKIGKEGELVAQESYATWPLFHKFRASEIFLSTYAKIYGHPFYREGMQETVEPPSPSGNKVVSTKKSKAPKKKEKSETK